jgi:hypothetical protein
MFSYVAVKETAIRYDKYAQNAFADFLKTAAIIPAPAERNIQLHSQLLHLGEHTIYVQVTPEKPDRQKRWSLRGRITSKAPNEPVEVLKEFDVDSDLYPQHRMGTSLPVRAAFIVVKDQ